MKALVTASARFAMTPDGNLWTANPSLDYTLWARYLDVYDAVKLLARVQPQPEPPTGWRMATGPRVSAITTPDYAGVRGLLGQLPALRQAARTALRECHAIHLRVACNLADSVWFEVVHRRPYALEVINDPYNVFMPGSVNHPLRPLMRVIVPRQLRYQCAHACAALYVTKAALQSRYPCPHYSVGVSDVDLPAEAFAPAPRQRIIEGRPVELVFVGSFGQLYKAPDLLIAAVAQLVREGLQLRLTLIGSGGYLAKLEQMVRELDLVDHVHFSGQLKSSEAVRAALDQADLFVMPSRMEGLPRAMVEAMARALPCIGSSVGGIPELLAAEDLVPPNDVAMLVHRIRTVVSDPARMQRMSERNLARAQQYQPAHLHPQRTAFYRHVRAQTERWRAGQTQQGWLSS